METEALEQIVIDCLKENLELSDEPVPLITPHTKPASDLNGFDSLRTIEVIISLEEKLNCDLPLEKIVGSKKFEEVSVKDIAQTIDKLIKAKKT